MSTIERMSYYASLDIPPIAKTKSVEQPAVGDCWECEREMSKANNALEKLVATEIDYGVQYANLPRGFHLIYDIDPNGVPRLVTRREQRSVVETAYKKSREMLENSPNIKWYIWAMRGSLVSGRAGPLLSTCSIF